MDFGKSFPSTTNRDPPGFDTSFDLSKTVFEHLEATLFLKSLVLCCIAAKSSTAFPNRDSQAFADTCDVSVKATAFGFKVAKRRLECILARPGNGPSEPRRTLGRKCSLALTSRDGGFLGIKFALPTALGYVLGCERT